jgi:hypothetical protein
VSFVFINHQQIALIISSLLFYSAALTCFDTCVCVCVSSSGSSSLLAKLRANWMLWLIRLWHTIDKVLGQWQLHYCFKIVSHGTIYICKINQWSNRAFCNIVVK